jgi:hypothetical protein
MAKANRYPKLIVILWRQDHGDPAAAGGRPSAQIDRDIQEPSSEAPHQFPLSGGMGLEVNTPYRAHTSAQRLIVLNELDWVSLLRELVETEDFGEVTPLVCNFPRTNFQRSVDIESSNFHFIPVDGKQR